MEVEILNTSKIPPEQDGEKSPLETELQKIQPMFLLIAVEGWSELFCSLFHMSIYFPKSKMFFFMVVKACFQLHANFFKTE